MSARNESYTMPQALLEALAIAAGLIASACAECHQVYRIKAAAGARGGISHGVCRACDGRGEA
jgi:hypothetical protein